MGARGVNGVLFCSFGICIADMLPVFRRPPELAVLGPLAFRLRLGQPLRA